MTTVRLQCYLKQNILQTVNCVVSLVIQIASGQPVPTNTKDTKQYICNAVPVKENMSTEEFYLS